MKKILFYLLIPVFLLSCKKQDKEEMTPRSEVPDEMVGQWLYGNFSMSDFWRYDGSYVGNAFELAVAFNFTQDGHYEFYFASTARDYACQTQAFTYSKGTVVFNDDNSFTVY